MSEICESTLDGVLKYEASLALSPNNAERIDADNFYPADGARGCPCGCGGRCGCQSGFLGGLIPSKAERKQNRERRQKRKDIRTQSKAQARVQRTDAKVKQAAAQQTAAQSLGTESQSDIELAKAIAGDSGKGSLSSMSTGAKIGIGVGVVAALGLVGFMLYKASKKK